MLGRVAESQPASTSPAAQAYSASPKHAAVDFSSVKSHPTSSLEPGLSVVVPVYNSAGTLTELAARLAPVLTATGLPFEVILINDGSVDHSWHEIELLAQHHGWVRGISLMRNYGQHNAVLAGTRAARYATTITMDDDLQHPPEELPVLLGQLTSNVDVVYGTPQVEPHGLARNLASVLTKYMFRAATGASNARMISAWRVFRTDLREAFAAYHSPFVSLDVLLTWSTTRFVSVKVPHAPRSNGSSNYGFTQLLHHAVNIMTGYSVLPLQFASFTGFALTLFGVGILSFVVGRYFVAGSTVAGFPFLASIIAIFSGAQLFALGIIGEYLARIHFRTMNKPPYAVRATVESTPPNH